MSDMDWIRRVKNKARSWRRRAERLWVRAFRSYDGRELVAALRSMGIESGDTVMLHSAFEPQHGFRGTTEDLIDAFLTAVGPQGHL